jgi:hypothetical protein
MVQVFAQQSVTITGFVKDAQTGETLISANVALLEINRGSATNTQGYFSIPNIPPGTYTIAGSYIGYKLFKQEITLNEGENMRFDINLQPEVFVGEEIVVESEAEIRELKQIGNARVKTELIKALPAVFEADVFRSIQYLPGVKSASDFSSGLYIRGGSPDQTLILLDQTSVYNPSHFFGFFSTFNPDAIKDVRLYKGGYPAEFGGRIGSVLSVYNKDGNRNELHGGATLGMLASRAVIEGPFKKGSFMLAGRRSTLEPLLAALRSNNSNIPSTFYFYDFNGKVNYDASLNDKLSLAFYAGSDKVVFPFGDDLEATLNYGNQTLSGNWTHIFSEKVFSNFVVTSSRYFTFPQFEAGGTSFTRDNNIWDQSVKADVEFIPNELHQISAGVWAGVFTMRIVDKFDGQESFSPRIHARYASAYVQDTFRPTEKLMFLGGIRANYFSGGNHLRLEPRLSAEYYASNRLTVQAAYGRYNQFLTLVTNEAFSGFDTWLTTDKGINPAYGDQFVIGAKTVPFKDYGLDVEMYYRTMRDLFDLDPFLPDAAGLPYSGLFRIGDGYALGTEMMFEKQVGRLNGYIGYTFGYTWRKYPGFNVAIGSEDLTGRYYPPKYDRRNDVKLILNYNLSRKWKLTGAWVYATGQAYTYATGRYAAFDEPFSSVEQNDLLVVENVNARRLPPYHRLDISFSRTGTFFGLGEAELRLQVINAYNRKNVWFTQIDFEENPITRSDITLLPVIPAISYTIKF